MLPSLYRTHERIALETPVSMESENNFYAGISDNISEGGVFVATYDAPPLGSIVDLKLSLPDHPEPFCFSGVVRWHRAFGAACSGMPPGVGIEWLDIPETALRAIRAFVQQRETLLFDAA